MPTLITPLDPATGAVLDRYEAWAPERIDQAVDAGHAAALAWGRQPLDTRVAAVRRLADELRRQKDAFARLITLEMGKPLAEAAGELEKSAVTALYYADHADHAERLLGDERVSMDAIETTVAV